MIGFAVPSKLKVAAALGVAAILLVSAGFGLGYGYGGTKATEKAAEAMDAYKEEVREREREQERLLAEANDRNREQEKAHEQRVADLRAEFAQQQADAAARDQRTIADLRSGNQRLRLQVTSCRAASAGSPEPAPGGADGAGSAELAPETAAALWGIAGDGDRAIRRLTALQAWARSAVQTCNTTENPQ
ncbi:Rz protein [Bordetella phage CN1]|uniref:Rz protein n=1 Tax=Bordetella phage CN1 TaxID=1916123 RepID=A0A2D0WBW5_9CAUD|nr:Rz-like spanin [Bordetella phage CN1]APL99441.1 Rz protein [Bordetella phage CN1]